MPEDGKPLPAQVREAVSYDLEVLSRTADATRETARSGVPVTAESMLGEIIAMEKILDGLRRAVTREL